MSNNDTAFSSGNDIDLESLIHRFSIAEIHCLTIDELFQRLSEIWRDEYFSQVVSRVLDINLTDDKKIELGQIVYRLASLDREISSKERMRIDRVINRLLCAIPHSLAIEILTSSLKHRRKARRKLAENQLKHIGVDVRLSEVLISKFKETGDESFLQLIARSKYAVPFIDYQYLLNNLSNPYWRMRVIESLILAKPEIAIAIAESFPYEFVYAIGRQNFIEGLPKLKKLLERYTNTRNMNFVSISIWVVGKFAARQELEIIRNILEGQLKESSQALGKPPMKGGD